MTRSDHIGGRPHRDPTQSHGTRSNGPPSAGVTTYAYDTENNLTDIYDANQNHTQFAYINGHQLQKTTFPSGLYETYVFDGLDNLTSRTDRNGNRTAFYYDSLSRMYMKLYTADGSQVSYTYDAASRLTQVNDANGVYTFGYDNMNRLTSTGTNYWFDNAGNYTVQYGYDAASNRTSMKDPQNLSTSYGYDTLNRLNSLVFNGQNPGFGFGYDNLSRRNSLTRPNGVTTSYAYDSVSRLLSVIHQLGSTTLDGASYTYDNAGNRTSKTDLRTNTTSNYGYDSIYQLLQVTQGASTTETYSYDKVGNRLSTLGVSPYSYNSSNELTSTPSVTYTYDNNGNTKTKSDGSQYTWDYENRLMKVVLPGSGGTVNFKYDPFGRRVQKSFTQGSTTTTTNYLYDGPNLLEEVDNSGNVLARYTQGSGIDSPVSMLRGGVTSYYEQDGIGAVTSLSNSAGALANTYSFDSFGKLTASTGTLANPFQYTGREFDPETGIYEYRARYYDQNVGRFLSEDTDRQDLGKSLYAYVGNNPGIFVDPSGLVARLYCDIIPTGRGRTFWQQVGLAVTHPTHCYLYVSCHGSGHYLELYGPPENGKYGIPHNDQPFNLDRANNSTQHTLTPPAGMGCCEFERRLERAFDHQASNLPQYSGSGPNSNTFVNNIIQEAGGTADFPWNAFGWDNGTPPPSPADSMTMPPLN